MPRLFRSVLPSVLLSATLFSAANTFAAEPVTIKNPSLQVTIDPAKGTFSLTSVPSGTQFLTDGKLAGPATQSKTIDVADKTFGKGRGIEMTFADGAREEVDLFSDLPFALFRSTLHNGGHADARVTSIQPFGATLDLGKAPSDLRVLSTAGLQPADQKTGGYEWMAVADPATRHGVVAGWLTHDRAGGVMLSESQGDHVHLQPQSDFGRLRIAPGGDAQGETLAVGYFDDARLGLEAWASAIAKIYDIHLHPQPVGYCTWYSDQHGGASNEKALAEITAAAAKELGSFGFSLIQIDDGWQEGIKDNGPKKVFSAYNPKGPYPSGMKATADNITAHGLTAGIWFMPFAGTWDDPFFKDHQDWFVKTADGKPYVVKWGGTSLDMTNPAVQQYLREEVHRIAGDWGYRYFKMDGMFTGTGTKLMYINSSYKPDDMGDALFSNPDVTNIQAYRTGLKIVRETAGDGVFLLGCCAPQNMRSYGGAFGLVDAMRVGPDNGPKWQSLLRGPTFASRSYFLNGRVWWNDPDPVYVRASMPIEHSRLIASWVTIAGDLNLFSDWLPALPPERVDILRRTMPSHGLPSRPVDLFDNELPRIWLLTDDRHEPRRDVIGLYNWTSQPLPIDEPVERIGLPGNGPFVAFDFWADAFVPAFEGHLRTTLPKESCQVLAVRAVADHPQLISTSRHITQGIVDVTEERWDTGASALVGKSKVVAGDPYELRIVVPGENWKVASVEVSSADQGAGVKIANKPSTGGVRVGIDSPASREVSWTVRFRH